jgi:endonuclease-3 related protein
MTRHTGRPATRPSRELRSFYDALMAAYGPQHWWPARTPLEVVVGAILTQNTNWKNVERAIDRLRQAGALDWKRLHALTPEALAELVRPAGTFRVKARRLKAFVEFLFERYGGRLEAMADRPTEALREELLGVSGIGRETADCILLYALHRPVFVVDAYTRRVLLRHGVIDADADYETLRTIFEDGLPADVRQYNEYHALLVSVGKRHCRAAARCEGCPLERFPHCVECA